MTLKEKQILFTKLVATLITYAYSQGYELTFGETYRSPETAAIMASQGKGIANSLHTLKLAIDLNLFQHGVYLPDTEDHKFLGEWWEKQHSLCRWGGRFKDGNHYSLEHNGVK